MTSERRLPRPRGRDVPLRKLKIRRSTDKISDRLWLVRRRWRTLLRLSAATSLAYYLATELFGHEQAFFAPIAAVIVLIAGAGLRGRVLLELVFGVALGVGIGETLVLGIGRGAWQMALIVVLAVVAGTLVGLKGLALNQAATSSILLAAIVPTATNVSPAFTRFVDALLGGIAGWLAFLLIPRNPVRDVDREVQRVLTSIADIMRQLAHSLRAFDADAADRQLQRSREMTGQVDVMASTAANVSEVARMSPMRWQQREHVEVYVATVADLDNAVRDTRVLARKTATLLRHSEVVPTGLDEALDEMARAIEIFADDLSELDDFDEARESLIASARLATTALTKEMSINSASVASSIRSLAADLLYASGWQREEVDQQLDFGID